MKNILDQKLIGIKTFSMTLKQNLNDKINGKTIFNDKMKSKDGDKKATGKTFTTNWSGLS